MNILILEDEQKIAAFLVQGLSEAGHSLTVAHNGKEGLDVAIKGTFDMMIFDVMLPELSGIEVCKQVRLAGITTPILMLTALSSLDDKVSGLEAGADDYLAKPFHFKELLARIQAHARRNNIIQKNSDSIKFGDLILDRSRKIALRDNKSITLTAKEYTLLELFMTSTDKVLSRDDIGTRIWGEDFDSNSNVIDVYINYLRNKIEKGFSSKLIHTMVGMGYVMKEQ